VTLIEVKAALGISGATADDDTYLNRQIDIVSERARSYTNRNLNSATYEEIFYSPGVIVLGGYPIISITTLTRDGTTVTPADIRADLRRGRIWQTKDSGKFDWFGSANVTVNYTGGYATLPAGIAEWAFIAINAGWEDWNAGGRGLNPGGKVERKIDFADAGSVEYESRGVFSKFVPDWLVRAPLSALDPWVDKAGPMSDEYSVLT
jgi:hypothetical protein